MSDMKIVVASKNPVKIDAALKGSQLMFPNRQIEVAGYSVPSEVADQPMTEAETKAGAFNRVKNVALLQPQADLWVAIEGGCQEQTDIRGQSHLEVFAWVMVMDKNNLWGEARSASFQLPEAIAKLVRIGVELGVADDMVFKRTNSKHDTATVGALTGDAVPRLDYYIQPMALALIPMKNPTLYS